MRTAVSMLKQPEPVIHLNQDVCYILGIEPFTKRFMVAYKDIVIASGPYSGLTARLDHILGRKAGDLTILDLQAPNYAYQGYRISNILQCQDITDIWRMYEEQLLPPIDPGEFLPKIPSCYGWYCMILF